MSTDLAAGIAGPETAPPDQGWRDWLLVLGLLCLHGATAIVEPASAYPGVSVAATAVLVTSLLWRRSHPWMTVAAITVFQLLSGIVLILEPSSSTVLSPAAAIALLVGIYALFRWANIKASAIGALSLLAGHFIVELAQPDVLLIDVFVAAGFWLFPAALGSAIRSRVNSQLRLVKQVRSNERELLARELHDTVAHNVSAMSIQAQAGRTLARSNEHAAVEALLDIEATAKTTLAEMRAMLVALRESEAATLVPQPGAENIVELAATSGAPSIAVNVTGDVDGLAPSLDTAIYRIAKEAVTNATKHARRATTIEVDLHGGDDTIQLNVSDDGEMATTRRSPPAGFGLLGMTERANMLGGSLRWGPTPHGGWLVSAELPRTGAGG